MNYFLKRGEIKRINEKKKKMKLTGLLVLARITIES